MKKIKKEISFKSVLKENLKSPEFKLHFEEVSMHLKIARLLEEVRKGCDLTQAEVAEKAGVSTTLITRLENGYQKRVPTIKTVSKIFSVLGYFVDLVFKKQLNTSFCLKIR